MYAYYINANQRTLEPELKPDEYKINNKYNLLRINISDSRDSNENIAQYFTKCIDFIETNKYDNILIHCNKGVSGSVT